DQVECFNSQVEVDITKQHWNQNDHFDSLNFMEQDIIKSSKETSGVDTPASLHHSDQEQQKPCWLGKSGKIENDIMEIEPTFSKVQSNFKRQKDTLDL